MSTAMTGPRADRQNLLRRALLIDGLFSGSAGVALATGAGFLADHFGLPEMMLRLIGVALLPYAAALLFLASRVTSHYLYARGVVIANLVWVAGSGVLLLSGWVDPTSLGIAFVIAQALAVAAFAELQFMGLRRFA